ncbi:intradiol ring-cleavage dioxygenase [Aestuariivirga litoralis]|nr:intradiol ring-cleavage dioxygenase [Aestuariivirga litoralis]
MSYYFTVKDSVKVVQDRSGPKADKRVKYLTDTLVKHLHAFIKEARPSMNEWMYGINFLTRTGHLSTDWRQEFILLSDTLGVSMLVESLNHSKMSGETESTVLGPFYIANAPHYPNGANICLDGKGAPVWVHGRVLDSKRRPIPGAKLDVWQANEDGFYDVQQKGVQPDMNLRGVFESDDKGRYYFRSAYPKFYPIPYDGSVGDMLKALDRNPNRPAHLHFIVSAPGYETVTTHIFTPDCPWLKDDAVFGVKESLIADFKDVNDAKKAAELGMPNPFKSVEWNFVLSKEKK